MKKMWIKVGLAILPLFIIGHLTQNWGFVFGGLFELVIMFALFYRELTNQ